MSKTTAFAHRSADRKETWWYLVQEDDGTLHVQIELLGADGQQAEHAVPINEFLRFGEKRLDLQELVDRMFDED